MNRRTPETGRWLLQEKAKAWREGYEAGSYDQYIEDRLDTFERQTPNPYETKEKTQ